jgi:hypothetical protein
MSRLMSFFVIDETAVMRSPRYACNSCSVCISGVVSWKIVLRMFSGISSRGCGSGCVLRCILNGVKFPRVKMPHTREASIVLVVFADWVTNLRKAISILVLFGCVCFAVTRSLSVWSVIVKLQKVRKCFTAVDTVPFLFSDSLLWVLPLCWR